MQHRKTLIRSVSCLTLAAGIAQADTKTFNVSNGDWDIGTNWTPTGVPGADTRAVIPANKTCNIRANAVADSIEILASGQSLGALVIKAGFTLTLDNDTDNASPTGADHSKVDGELVIDGIDAVLKFIDNSHVISGIGRIEGTASKARIDIEADIKFTSRLDSEGIVGAMEIRGLTGGTTNGIFRNDGIVHATLANNVLKLAADTLLEDHRNTGTAKWKASKKSTLEFERIAALRGDFILSCGTFDMKASIRTCGMFIWNKGDLVIDTSRVFAYESFSSSMGCLNPENAVLSARDCTKWEVNDFGSPYSCGVCPDPS